MRGDYEKPLRDLRALPQPATHAPDDRRRADCTCIGFGWGVFAGVWSDPALWAAACVLAGRFAALAGFALSALIWLVVAVATPAPVTVLDAAREGARRVHDRLPAEIREAAARRAAGEDYGDLIWIDPLKSSTQRTQGRHRVNSAADLGIAGFPTATSRGKILGYRLKRMACQLASVVVMSAMLAAGTVCIMPEAASHPVMAGCHHRRSPRPAQPADYRCCMSRYRPAIVTNISSPPVLRTIEAAGANRVLVKIRQRNAAQAIPSTGGLPALFLESDHSLHSASAMRG